MSIVSKIKDAIIPNDVAEKAKTRRELLEAERRAADSFNKDEARLEAALARAREPIEARLAEERQVRELNAELQGLRDHRRNAHERCVDALRQAANPRLQFALREVRRLVAQPGGIVASGSAEAKRIEADLDDLRPLLSAAVDGGETDPATIAQLVLRAEALTRQVYVLPVTPAGVEPSTSPPVTLA